MQLKTSEMETIAGLPFLQENYEDEGVDVGAALAQVRAKQISERETLSQGVARKIMELLKAGRRDFPTFEIPDPSATIAVPTRILPQRFSKVMRSDLLAGQQTVPHIEHEGYVHIISPLRNKPGDFRQLGGLLISTHPLFDIVDTIHLGRSSLPGEAIKTDAAGLTDHPEALAFLFHTQNYLDRLE